MEKPSQKDLKDDGDVVISYIPDLLAGIVMIVGSLIFLFIGLVRIKFGVGLFLFGLVLFAYCWATGIEVTKVSLKGLRERLKKVFSRTG